MAKTAITDELTRVGFSVTPDFLGARQVAAISSEMSEFLEAGEFGAARIGGHHLHPDVRSDSSRWFDMADGTLAQKMSIGSFCLIATFPSPCLPNTTLTLS